MVIQSVPARVSVATSSESKHVYELSRELFRSLRPGLLVEARHPSRPARSLLALCEETVRLVAMNPATAKLQARRLFNQSRRLYPVGRQLQLLTQIDRSIERIATELLTSTNGGRRSLLRCVATTRHGRPCLREPLLGRHYCPSHKHLDQPVETVDTADSAAVLSGSR